MSGRAGGGKRPIRVGLIGCGTVGGGVAEALLGRRRPWERDGLCFELARAADVKWPAGSVVPKRLRTSRAFDVTRDPRVDVVVELVGGTDFAHDVVADAIEHGKHVVTANKALLAERGDRLFRRAHRAGREIAFEAAVAGGIPVLQAIQTGMSANTVNTVYGILNGTTNYILSRMTETRASFAEALPEAQRLGFAEADPTLDVDGFDAAHKIQLLTALAFGLNVPMKRIPVNGIRGVDPLDIAYAAELGCCIKLLAAAKMIPAGLEIRVAPTLVPYTHLLSGVKNEVNAVFVNGSMTGDLLFVGKGAGRYPTASAIVSDLVSMAKSGFEPRNVRRMVSARRARPVSTRDFRSRYYLRMSAVEKPGVLAKVTEILGRAGISIASIVQLDPGTATTTVPLALLTHETTEARIQNATREINTLPVIRRKTVVFPIID